MDIYSIAKRWNAIVPKLRAAFRTQVSFRQASVESLPFEENMFDVIESSAVMEHVRNVRAAVEETVRVLKPGGWVRHDFGPLYYTFSGDHCASDFGRDHGYDHLLLSESEYRTRISDQGYFDGRADPNAPFWARNDQFSFLRAGEYLEQFAARFNVRYVIVKISEEALAYRERNPGEWSRLLEAGISEPDLLVKSLAIVMQKPG